MDHEVQGVTWIALAKEDRTSGVRSLLPGRRKGVQVGVVQAGKKGHLAHETQVGWLVNVRRHVAKHGRPAPGAPEAILAGVKYFTELRATRG